MTSRSFSAAAPPGAGLLLCLCLQVLCLAACSGPPGAGRRLGSDLGGFRVEASALSNGCGAGALGSQPSFEFSIDLSREYSELFWGRQGSGEIDLDLGFELAATVSVAVGEPDAPARARASSCVIQRTDSITGRLEADASGDVFGFSARMRHAFGFGASTECSIDERIAAGLPRLPCEMEYALSAVRTRTPELEPPGP